ncbi:MAG: hypothetical protein FWF24_02265 [Alphaproteobacteria bacterium]|nr:hypothetical protein [Alphaproteobacteria bacterium]
MSKSSEILIDLFKTAAKITGTMAVIMSVPALFNYTGVEVTKLPFPAQLVIFGAHVGLCMWGVSNLLKIDSDVQRRYKQKKPESSGGKFSVLTLK